MQGLQQIIALLIKHKGFLLLQLLQCNHKRNKNYNISTYITHIIKLVVALHEVIFQMEHIDMISEKHDGNLIFS